MLKTLRVPLINLASVDEDCFLEFFIEPMYDNGYDGLESIAHGTLKLAVAQARAALKMLPAGISKSRLRLINSDEDLSTSAGAALGFALSPVFLQAECSYQHFIVTGTLNISESSQPDVLVGDSGALIEKMRSVCRLGYQVQPTVFIMPVIKLNAEVKTLYQTLARNNIAVRAVKTLEQACRACNGQLTRYEGSVHDTI